MLQAQCLVQVQVVSQLAGGKGRSCCGPGSDEQLHRVSGTAGEKTEAGTFAE